MQFKFYSIFEMNLKEQACSPGQKHGKSASTQHTSKGSGLGTRMHFQLQKGADPPTSGENACSNPQDFPFKPVGIRSNFE
ncbi:hypothetical protein [Deinococcus cellulosilyticus]|uniref:hypothetical protein n=1 Tax=Deinococcus cellulosilyticus TaxID=401558 RepID=UPI0011BDBCFE|nr:hypothetical protein [Deinococcus cellulosilyticus]